MISINKNRLQFFSILFVLINLIPLAGLLLNLWPLKTVTYFYWLELVGAGLYALVPHVHGLITFVLFLVGLFFLGVLKGLDLTSVLKLPITFWSLYFVCWLGYIELSKTRHWVEVRKSNQLKFYSYYFTYMFMAFSVCLLFTGTLFNVWWIVPHIPLSEKLIFIFLAILVPSVTLCFIRIIEIVGSRHFIKFFLGTYYVPKSSDLIIVFLDMVGSSEMAERVGAERNMMFISQFIYDVSSVFKKNGGDILNFTGDGLLVTWPRKNADKALDAIKQLNHKFIYKKDYYLKQFDTLPEYRVGGHAGKVTMAQIGDGKLFLALCGDVVNTASRIEELNKRFKTKVLISEDFFVSISSNKRKDLIKVGKERLRGKLEELEVYTFKGAYALNDELDEQLNFNFI